MTGYPQIQIYAGGPCSCMKGRYVRFVIPARVPGLTDRYALVSCQDNDSTAHSSVMVHEVPNTHVPMIRCPRLR